jgi:hypothetical protein
LQADGSTLYFTYDEIYDIWNRGLSWNMVFLKF